MWRGSADGAAGNSSEKWKKSESMVQGQVFLKGGGGLALFIFNFFKVYHFYIYKLFYPLQNCYAFEEKLFFSVTIILWKKIILSCLGIC